MEVCDELLFGYSLMFSFFLVLFCFASFWGNFVLLGSCFLEKEFIVVWVIMRRIFEMNMIKIILHLKIF